MTLRLAGRCAAGGFRLDVEMSAGPGDVVAVLGPNGAGKSTLLRTVAGLSGLAAGTLRLGDDVLDDPAAGRFVPAARRRVGMVFADHRLFPSMTVLENAAFGLRARGVAARTARAAARTWLQRLDVETLADRRAHQLSGGQSQRVALARALASRPELLLLDEPLAALDVATRAGVQDALAEHVAGFAGPTLLVTHDPLEALLLADRLLVLEGGRVVQSGPPAQVTARPATPYVARVAGVGLWAGRAAGRTVDLDGGGRVRVDTAHEGPVLVAASPRELDLHRERPGPAADTTHWPGRVASLAAVGDTASGTVRVRVTGPPDAAVDLTPAAVAALGLGPGVAVWVGARAAALHAYPPPA